MDWTKDSDWVAAAWSPGRAAPYIIEALDTFSGSNRWTTAYVASKAPN